MYFSIYISQNFLATLAIRERIAMLYEGSGLDSKIFEFLSQFKDLQKYQDRYLQ